jgi:lipid A 3-O-deacylase
MELRRSFLNPSFHDASKFKGVRNSFCLWIAALLWSGLPASAGPQELITPPPPLVPLLDSAGRLTFREENPIFAPEGRDRHYTNGAALLYLTPQLKSDSILDAPIRLFGNANFLFERPSPLMDDRFEWQLLGQNIYTPQDHHARNPSLNDRPYAGWLYTGGTFIQNNDDKVLTTLVFQLGVVGPAALGHQTQNNYHDFFGQNHARGWHYQLSNQFGFQTTWGRRWRFHHPLSNGYGWEFITNADITAGNVMTYAEAGGLVRWGRGLLGNWGPDLAAPGYSGTSYFSAARAGTDWGFDIHAGVEGRVIALNVFLDGNNFQDSRNVDKEYVVADALIGTEIFYRDRFRLGFTFVTRSPEFRQQRGPDTYGSFDLSFGL